MIYTDRSRIETGFQCPRKRFHQYLAGGRGYVPAEESQDLWFGKMVHAAIESATTGKEPEPNTPPSTLESELTEDGNPQLMEWLALGRGLVETFKRFTLPQLLDEYEWVASEQEMSTLLAPDVTLMSRLDGVLRRRSDGVYFVLEAKTSSWPQRLIDQSRTNFQLLLECHALQQHIINQRPGYYGHVEDEPEVGGAILLVFDKGQRKKDYKGEGYRRLSPFTYCYSKEKANGTVEYALEYKSGWSRTPSWQVEGWYDLLVERWPEVVKSQVQVFPSVDFDAQRVQSVITQVVALERRLAYTGVQPEPYADVVWPQNFAACADTYGKQCPYFGMCFSPRVAADPLATGEWRVREPNHPIEFAKEKQ